MNSLRVVSIGIVTLFGVMAASGQWQPAMGLEGIPIYGIDIFRGDPDTVYASGLNYFMRSTNRGEIWDTVRWWTTSGSHAIKVDPTNSQIIYISKFSNITLESNDVLMSTDGGQNWRLLFGGRGFPANVVEIDPLDPSTVYVGVGPSFIYRTTDQGATWDTTAQPPATYLVSLAIAATNDSILFAGYVSGTFKSSDRGNSWFSIPLESQPGVGPWLAVDPHDANVVYAGIYALDTNSVSGIFKSTDGGFTWVENNSGLKKQDRRVRTITINPKYSSELFIGVSQDSGSIVFRSTDAGETWQSYSDNLPTLGGANSIVIDTLNGRIFTTSGGIYFSDSGSTGVDGSVYEHPRSAALYQNFPNPFNPKTMIKFNISTIQDVNLSVYDILGRKVETLIDERMSPGSYATVWIAEKYPSGVYYYRLKCGDYTQSKRMILLK